MADAEHLTQLQKGVDAWNAWRHENHDVYPDLSKANLSEADLSAANLRRAYLRKAILSGANLRAAVLRAANLNGAQLLGADLRGADLSAANLSDTYLRGADLSGAILRGVNLSGVDLSGRNLQGVNLSGADLSYVNLVEADLTGANLTGCRIYGVSAWGLKVDRAKQENLVITPKSEPEITVDNIEVAQFVYLLLHNQKIRDVIDTITSKAVLILGRFTPERKQVLDALREELRKHDYVPILFDFEKPTSQNLTATIMTLARLARFIIADLTDPSSIPYELGRIVPNTKVAVQPILLSSRREFAMFRNLQEDYHWVLPTYRYDNSEQLIVDLPKRVISPAERKVMDLQPPKSD
jgi:hypothetical protein